MLTPPTLNMIFDGIVKTFVPESLHSKIKISREKSNLFQQYSISAEYIGFFTSFRTGTVTDFTSDIAQSFKNILGIFTSNLGIGLLFLLYLAPSHVLASITHCFHKEWELAWKELSIACHDVTAAAPYFLLHSLIDMIWEAFLLCTRLLGTLYACIENFIYPCNRPTTTSHLFQPGN